MSKLGEVVYCIDCDAAREQNPERPRRMATKRDANGDPLCTACLDARLAQRRGAFLLHEGRAPLPESRPAPAPEPEKTRSSSAPRRLSAIRVERTREGTARAPEVGTLARKTKHRDVRVPTVRVPSVNRTVERARDRRFVLLAAELGFLRAQQLLDDMSHAIGAMRLGSSARKDRS